MKDINVFILLASIMALLACGCASSTLPATTTTTITPTTMPAETITTTPVATTSTEAVATTTTVAANISCARACSESVGVSYSGSFLCYSKPPASYCPNSTALIYYVPVNYTTCPSTQGCWCGIRMDCPSMCSVGACTNSTG